MSSTPVVPAVETPQQKLDRELAELNARKIADAKFEQEQSRVAAERKAYEESPEGKKSLAREGELRNQAARQFLLAHPEFSYTKENTAEVEGYLVANNLPYTAENLSIAYDTQWKAGRLTPRPYVPPAPDAPRPFDTRGLTRAKIDAMPAGDYRRLISSPSGKAIVDYILAGGN